MIALCMGNNKLCPGIRLWLATSLVLRIGGAYTDSIYVVRNVLST